MLFMLFAAHNTGRTVTTTVRFIFQSKQLRRMSHKFAANLSFLFTEQPLLSQRYRAAKDAGFKFVECGFPYMETVETLQKAKQDAGVEQVLINAWPGDMKNGEIGIAALPNKKAEFQAKMETTIQYAKALNCKKVHIMAGVKPKFDDVAMEEVFLDNIAMAAEQLQKEGIMALIEPINNRISIPSYFLTDVHKAVEYIKKINHPNLKLQLDLYHIQIMDGNLTKNLKQYLPYIGHIQIAQVPARGEPDSDGEINFSYIFKLLNEVGYDGYIGLEYKPQSTTVEGLKWLNTFGLSL